MATDTEKKQIRERVARMRSDIGLDADGASDEVWVRRISGGSHDFSDAREALKDKARTNGIAVDPRSDDHIKQIGAAPKDSQFESVQERAERIAQIRENRGLPANRANDLVLANNKDRSIGEIRTMLTNQAREGLGMATISQSDVATTARMQGQADAEQQQRSNDAATARMQGQADEAVRGGEHIKQVGAAPKDSQFNTREERLERIAQIRENRGLPANPADDRALEREGRDISSIRTELTNRARNNLGMATISQSDVATTARMQGQADAEQQQRSNDATTARMQGQADAYQGSSIVDFLESQGEPSSYAARKDLAERHGISDYSGSASQNTQLLNALRGSSATTARMQGQADAHQQQRSNDATTARMQGQADAHQQQRSNDATTARMQGQADARRASTAPYAASVAKPGDVMTGPVSQWLSGADSLVAGKSSSTKSSTAQYGFMPGNFN